MRGSVKIRPIKTAEFDSKYTIGYEVANSVLTDNLSTYEMYCIKSKRVNMRVLKKRKSREIKRNFWTPDYCFIGSLLSQEDSVSLKQISLMLTGDKQKMRAKEISKNFNKSIPNIDRNYYYHYQVKTTNKAVMIYLKGVKFVASVLHHHEYLKRVGDIEEFLAIKTIVNDSGMAGLINQDVIALMAGYKQCHHFHYLSHEADFIVTNKDKLPSAIKAATEFYENNFNPQSHGIIEYEQNIQEAVSTNSESNPKTPAQTRLTIEKSAESKTKLETFSSSPSKTMAVNTNSDMVGSKKVNSESLVTKATPANIRPSKDDKDEIAEQDTANTTSSTPPEKVGWRELLNNTKSATVDGREIRTPSREDKEEDIISEDYVETGAYLQEIYQTNKGGN